MRRSRLLVLLLVVLIGAFVLTGVATAGPRQTSTFTLVVYGQVQSEIERGLVFVDQIETTTGEPVDGWDGGRCINLSPDLEAVDKYMCEMVFRLPEGDLAVSAVIDFNDIVGDDYELAFAVTGGTGAFRNARGEVVLTPYPGDVDRGYVHFRLIGANAGY
jgi:hypothetical protein